VLAKINLPSIIEGGGSKAIVTAKTAGTHTHRDVDESPCSIVAKSISQVTDWCNIIVVNSKHIRDILVSTFTRP
jgi:hypothetical protein